MIQVGDPYQAAARLMHSTHILSLGTFGPEGAWVEKLPFSVEPDFSLLIELANDSHHGLNLRINPSVAGALFDPERSPSHADSIQFTGMARALPPDQLEAALDRYHRQAPPGTADRIGWTSSIADFHGAAPRRMFRIALRSAFKLDLESNAPDRRLSLDIDRLRQVYLAETL